MCIVHSNIDLSFWLLFIFHYDLNRRINCYQKWKSLENIYKHFFIYICILSTYSIYCHPLSAGDCNHSRMLVVTLLFIVSTLASSDPGATWTEEESLIVKAKIYASLINDRRSRSNDYLELHPEMFPFDKWPERKSLPSAAKLIRLGFHHCLKNSDGTGGCNGCLNNHGNL